mmetsp:Transcript_44208/g.110716  ORF Transcript_44208/g.110716 Transcript_44208/m.110716 type:complete len:81 (+) Transcript_44208:57-299(+)|eukprot:CAMPEP_0173431952 /NCGR_PEP_ID=MMETSP1357-20121228/9923_1 /TAXON_ID=77926 /ORGANISM="Hemiselmis rufescens, Strain PCC563" /LENGTH=80 /DNA_ID=CAMNT_0014396487 /DNA_START=74 /DNA_END=316 /DNA_ORIENTATION=+
MFALLQKIKLDCPMCAPKHSKYGSGSQILTAGNSLDQHASNHGIYMRADAEVYMGGDGGLPKPAFRHGLQAAKTTDLAGK